MNTFVARQPIFDTEKKIYAYELLFRSGEDNAFPDIDGEIATNTLLSSSFFTVGIDKICSGKMAFINFPQKLIEQGIPQFFPPNKMTVEILENFSPSPEGIKACRELKRLGFQLALDDFVYRKELDELLELGDIIKFDFRFTPLESLIELLPKAAQYNCALLAEKVETYEEFHRAKEMGFQYFQGYFFSKPEILKNRELESSQLSMLQLINTINSEEDFDIDKLEEIISQDISITYKLINYINSPQFGRLEPISSIRQAISFLGETEIKLFLTLIATTNLNSDKPKALTRLSMVRARFLQKIGERSSRNSKEMFLLGLFSMIDAMLDQKIETLVSKLSLSAELSAALINREGELGTFLRLVECYENGNWIPFRYAQKRLAVTDEQLNETYLESVNWADSFDEHTSA